MDNVPVDVAACNLFARKLNLFARAALPLLSVIAAVSVPWSEKWHKFSDVHA